MLWLWVGANDGEGSGVNPPGGNGMAVWRREVAAAMTRAAEGDVPAFQFVCRTLHPHLLAFAKRRLQNHQADADEIAWDTLTKIHENRAGYERGADVVPWAYAIARRKIIDGHRKRKRSVEDFLADHDAPSRDGQPDELYVAKQLAKEARAALESLPEETREAFFLHYEDGLSLAEIARILGTSVGAIKQRLHRAREALRSILDPDARRPKVEDGDDDE